MSIKLTHGEYVKFVRTTSAVWSSVPDVQKDTDTLYFVLAANRESGDLYLGPTLITGVDSSFSLSDLNDVLTYNVEGLANGSLLMFNSTTHKWEPTSLFNALQAITESLSVMQGSTGVTSGQRGLVPDQPAGTQDFFLSGSGQWVNPTPVIQQVINTNAADWFGDDWDSTQNAPVNGQTIRDIASDEVAKIVAEAPGTFDTLKEIADWIEAQPTVADITNLTTRVTNVETRLFTDVPANPQTGAPAQPSLITQVTTLNANFSSLDSRVTAVESTLRWQDMTEEEEEENAG